MKSKTKFKLGPLQEYWLSQLEKHPERQLKGALGIRNSPKKYSLCCLGQLLVCDFQRSKKKLPFNKHDRLEYLGSIAILENFERYGLRSETGGLKTPFIKDGRRGYALTDMNDWGVTWPEIAAYIRKNPKNVFTKGV